MKKLSALFSTLLLITFVNLSFAQDTSVIDKVEGIVGNKIILYSEIEAQYLQAKARNLSVDRCKIFEDLLYQKLLVTQAEIDSVEVSDKEVDAELQNRLNTFIDQLGGVEKVEEYFDKPLAEIKENLRDVTKDQILAQRMRSEITKDIKVTPSEVNNFYRNLNKDSLPLIDLQLELNQIVVTPRVTKEDKEVVKNRLLQIKNDILKNGKLFETMAILYSEDPGSATKGGELGLMGRNELVPEFSAAAFQLKPDSISDIIETEFGYHIIQMIDRKGERVNVRHILIKPKFSSAAKAKAKEIADSIYSVLNNKKFSFEDAAKLFSNDEKTSKSGGQMVNPYNGTSQFSVDQIYPANWYYIKNLKPGEYSTPFETYDDKANTVYKIIMVKSKTDAHVASIETDYQIIQDMALEKKYSDAYDNWIREKQKTTYVKIGNTYKNCNFVYKGWLETDFKR